MPLMRHPRNIFGISFKSGLPVLPVSGARLLTTEAKKDKPAADAQPVTFDTLSLLEMDVSFEPVVLERAPTSTNDVATEVTEPTEKFTGKKELIYSDGSLYVGDFVNSLKHGFGTFFGAIFEPDAISARLRAGSC